jgi:hypothetical protein
MRPADETERRWGVAYAFALLWSVALAASVLLVVWGMVIAPFNDFNDHLARSLLVGAFLLACVLTAAARSDQVFRAVRHQPALLLAVALTGTLALWADGGWRSSFYLASYSAIGLAAVGADLKWTLRCAWVLALGYVLGLAVNDYTWSELDRLRDADSVVANTGGYVIAALAVGLPLEFLRGQVGAAAEFSARISAVLTGGVAGLQEMSRQTTRGRWEDIFREFWVQLIIALLVFAISVLLFGRS